MKRKFTHLIIFLFISSASCIYSQTGSLLSKRIHELSLERSLISNEIRNSSNPQYDGSIPKDNGIPVISMAPKSKISRLEACVANVFQLPVKTAGFYEVGAYNLTIKYNPAKIQLIDVMNTAGFPQFEYTTLSDNQIIISGLSESAPVTLPDSSALFTLQFMYIGDSVPVIWYPYNDACRYYSFPDFAPLFQEPVNNFYFDGMVKEHVISPVSITIQSNLQECCQDSAMIFTAFPVNGGTMPQLTWMVNGNPVAGAAGSSFSYHPLAGDYITCQLNSNLYCTSGNPATSNRIDPVVLPHKPVSIRISTINDTLCAGSEAVYTAFAVNGGLTPVYQWKVNHNTVAGVSGNSFSYIPLNGDIITCTLISSEPCAVNNPAISNQVEMTVHPIRQVSLNIHPLYQEVCDGHSATFSATVVNGGGSPSFQWYVNNIAFPGATGSGFVYNPSNGDIVKCEVLSNETCPGNNPVSSANASVKVNPLKPVSITITPDINPSCQNSTVTLTATPVNGGANPVYNWTVNGIPAGVNNSHFSYIPSDNDVVKCTVTSNAVCPTGNPATSLPVSLDVTPLAPVSINVVPSSSDICDGTKVTFTAHTVNGGSTPVYEWKKNGIIFGSDTSVVSCFPANNDLITCKVTSNAACNTGNPAISSPVIMIVHPRNVVHVSVTSSATSVCDGTQVAFTASPSFGGASPSFQWRLNGNNIPGATGSSYAFVPVNGDSVSCKLTSSDICAIHNPAISQPINLTVFPNLHVSVTTTASAMEVCDGTTVNFTSSVVNGGSNPSYQWKVNGISRPGATSSGYSYIPLNGDSVTCMLTSSVECPVGNPATSEIKIIKVNPNKPVGVSVTSNSNPSCAGSTVTFKAKPVNGGTNPVYQWKVNGVVAGSNSVQYSFIPSNNDLITCTVISNAICPVGNPATSEPLTMQVNPLQPVSVSVVPSANNVCDGSKVLFTAFPVNGGSLPVYQWKKNGMVVGNNSPAYEYYPQNNDIITCILNSNAGCRTGNPAVSAPVTMVVNPVLPVSVTVQPSVSAVCTGSRNQYTAMPVNGGSNPVYLWQVNGNTVSGATASTFIYAPVTNDQVTCRLTSNAGCISNNPANSPPVSVAILPLKPVSVTVTPSSTNVCNGTGVTYTANPVNGGASPVYTWKVNGQVTGSSSSIYSYTPSNNDVVTCQLTSNIACPTGNPSNSAPINMTVNPLLPVSMTITPSASTVCNGTSVSFTSIITNGGTQPQYQWSKNGVNIAGATNSSFNLTPSNKDTLKCIVTSNAVCPTGNPATSNSTVLTVNPLLPVSIIVSPGAVNVCAGTSVQYTSTITNGGSTPLYQWIVNGANISGATNPTYSYVPANSDIVKCRITSNAVCPTGNPATSSNINMVVNPLLPVSIVISSSATTVCAGTTVNYSSTVTNGGTSPVYQWNLNGSAITGATGSSYSYVPVHGDAISCKIVSNALCPTGNPAISSSATMTVNPLKPVNLVISPAGNPVCAGTSVIYTTSLTNGGTTPVYQWMKNGTAISGATAASYTYIPVNSDQVTCKITSNEICATGNPFTPNPISMTVNPLLPVSVTLSVPSTSICSGNTATFTANPVNGGSQPTYQWLLNNAQVSGATGSTYTFTPVNGDNVKCTITSNATCPTGNPYTSASTAMTVNPLIPVSSSISATSYAAMPNTSVTFTASGVNTGTAPVYSWKINNTILPASTNSSYNYIPSNGDYVRCYVSSSLPGCLTNNPGASNIITMVIYTTGTPCTGTPTVSYGGKVYNTTQIGTQCWLRENMNIGTRVDASVNQANNGVIEKYCYNNDENYCNTYGGLYQWAEMVQYYNGVTNTTHWNPLPTNPVQGICPPGWHLPTNDEVSVLLNYYGGTTLAGGKMKETGVVHWNNPNTGATNPDGFTSLPGGNAYLGVFSNVRSYSTIWTVTQGSYSVEAAILFGAPYNFASSLAGQSYKITGYSVRCLKN